MREKVARVAQNLHDFSLLETIYLHLRPRRLGIGPDLFPRLRLAEPPAIYVFYWCTTLGRVVIIIVASGREPLFETFVRDGRHG